MVAPLESARWITFSSQSITSSVEWFPLLSQLAPSPQSPCLGASHGWIGTVGAALCMSRTVATSSKSALNEEAVSSVCRPAGPGVWAANTCACPRETFYLIVLIHQWRNDELMEKFFVMNENSDRQSKQYRTPVQH